MRRTTTLAAPRRSAMVALGGFVLALVAFIVLAAPPANAAKRHVIDEADVLSASVETQLEADIRRISSTYGQDVVVLFAELEGKSPVARADDYFDYNGYGVGPDRSGVLLLVAPGTRDWWISTRGESITTFTDRGIQMLGERVKEPLGRSDWDEGARVFISEAERYMKAAKDGSPIDGPQRTLFGLLAQGVAAVFVGLLGGIKAAFVAVDSAFVSKMSNKGLVRAARSQVVGESFTAQGADTFLGSHVSQTPKVVYESSSSGSGSSTHVSSSGATHGGGGGKF